MGDNRRELEARLVRLGPERLAAELLDLADYDRDIARRVKLLSREGDSGALIFARAYDQLQRAGPAHP